MSARCKAPASPSRIPTRRVAAAAGARSRHSLTAKRERRGFGARRAAPTEVPGARDHENGRGPSHVPSHVTERIRTVVVEDHEDIARLVATRIATLIRERNATGESTVLGLATGSTPIGVYREMIRVHKEDELSFARVVTFNLDEYFPMPVESIHSYHRFMWENFFSHVDIKKTNVHIPPGSISRDTVDEAGAKYEAE